MINSINQNFWSKFREFTTAVYEPKLHIAFAVFWAVSLEGNFFALVNHKLSVTSLVDGLIVSFCFFLILFFLRIIDEIKDYDYDKEFKPERPLASGLVGFKDAKLLAALVATAVFTINLFIDWRLALFVLINMLYGIFLYYLELWFEPMSNSTVLNTIITFPVSAMLNVYALLFFIWQDGLSYTEDMNWMILAYICAFLHFDVGRKTIWPHLTKPGEKFYSHEIGGMGSAILALILAVVACTIPLSLYQPSQNSNIDGILPWILLIPLVASIASFIKFIRNRDRRYEPRPFYIGFLCFYYITQLVNTALPNL